MEKSVVISFSATSKFLDKLEEYYNLVEKDEEYRVAVSKMNSRYNKKTKTNKLESAKLRFAVAYYLKNNRRKLLENAQTENSNKKEEDIR